MEELKAATHSITPYSSQTMFSVHEERLGQMSSHDPSLLPFTRMPEKPSGNITEAFDDDKWDDVDDKDDFDDFALTIQGTSDLDPRCGDVLKRVFKLDEFRKDQQEIIAEAMADRDILVLMPTGAGKNLCYELPAVLQNEEKQSVTVVISPLLALIRDQVQALRAKGVAVLTSSDPNIDEILSGDSKPALLYVTPEKIQKSPHFLDTLWYLYRGGKLGRFAIDEAHCISTWGPEFRDAVSKYHSSLCFS